VGKGVPPVIGHVSRHAGAGASVRKAPRVPRVVAEHGVRREDVPAFERFLRSAAGVLGAWMARLLQTVQRRLPRVARPGAVPRGRRVRARRRGVSTGARRSSSYASSGGHCLNHPDDALTDGDLSTIEELAAAATPGPWHVRRLGDNFAANLVAVSTAPATGRGNRWPNFDPSEMIAATLVQHPNRYVRTGDKRWDENARFIAHAREAIPQLIAEIRRLKNELEQTRSQVEDRTGSNSPLLTIARRVHLPYETRYLGRHRAH